MISGQCVGCEVNLAVIVGQSTMPFVVEITVVGNVKSCREDDISMLNSRSRGQLSVQSDFLSVKISRPLP